MIAIAYRHGWRDLKLSQQNGNVETDPTSHHCGALRPRPVPRTEYNATT